MINKLAPDVMIDCETLGLGDSPVLLSVAVATAHPDIPDEHWHIEAGSCVKAGLTLTPSTVLWWMEQSEEARMAILEGQADAITLDLALRKLYTFCLKHTNKDTQFWSFGASADLVWLRNAFIACDLPCPWTYRKERCLRTAVAMLDPEHKHRPENPLQHDALADAQAQMEYLMAIAL